MRYDVDADIYEGPRPRLGTPAVLFGFANQNQTAGVAEGSAGGREGAGVPPSPDHAESYHAI